MKFNLKIRSKGGVCEHTYLVQPSIGWRGIVVVVDVFYVVVVDLNMVGSVLAKCEKESVKRTLR